MMQMNRSLLSVVVLLSLLLGVGGANAQSITLANLNPNTLQSGPFTLTLTGTGFTPSCAANFTETSYPTYFISSTTTYVSSTQLTVKGNANAQYGIFNYAVTVSDTITQQTSNAVAISVYPAPISFNIYPNTAPAGSGALTLTASNYDRAPATITWTFNGVTTSFNGIRNSPSAVQFSIPASLLATPGVVYVSSPSYNVYPYYGTYTTVPFYITGKASISSLSPSAASAGDAAFTLTVNGAGFVSGDVVLWNGSSLATTFVSATQLQALVPASYISQRTFPNITVNNSYPAQFSVSTVHVSGKVSLEGETQLAQTVTLEFRAADNSVTYYSIPTHLAGDGSFDVRGINPTTYLLAVKGYKWLRNTVPLTVGQTPVSDVQIALLTGDANGDNSVDSSDFGLLIGAYGSDASISGSGYDIRADFNDDGFVDSTDFGLLIGDFNTQGDL